MTQAVESNLAGKLANGVIWTLMMRWSVRTLGLVSTMILARLLTPDDFGIAAMATVVSGLSNVLFEFGVATVLIQDPNPGREDYDSAWTLRLLQASLAGLCILAIAPYAVGYFGEPRLEPVLWLIALATMIGGMENIGVVQFQKTLDFKSDFQFEISRKLILFVATLSLAWVLQSYWALVIGILVERVLAVAVSYLLHPYRPRWSLVAFRKIWSFSRWILVLRIGAYVRNEVDKMVIGGRGDTTTMGHYSLASEIANMVTTEILAPINRAVFPALSKLNQHPGAMTRALHLALAAQATVTFPLAVGLALVADDAIPLLLGDQWDNMVPILQVLALVGIPLCIRYAFSSALTALRKLGVVSVLVWLEITAFLALVVFGLPDPSILDIVRTKIVLSMVLSMALLIYAVSIGLAGFSRLANALWRPIAAVIGMMGVLSLIQPFMTGMHGVDLLMQVTIGGGVYAALIFLSWYLSGRPAGIEILVMQRLGLLH